MLMIAWALCKGNFDTSCQDNTTLDLAQGSATIRMSLLLNDASPYRFSTGVEVS